MYVCMCYGVTDKQIKQAVDQGATNMKSIRQALNVGSQCGKCIRMTQEVIQQQLDVTPNYYQVA